MKKLAVLVLVVAVFAVLAVHKGTKVEVTCGPAVTTPLGTKAVDGAGQAGSAVRGFIDHPRSDIGLVRFSFAVVKFLRMVGGVFTDALNGKPESKDAQGWKVRTGDAQRKALASCCPQLPTDPTQPPVAPAAPPPFDPKTASLQTGGGWTSEQLSVATTAARVAADRNLPARAALVEVTAGLVESELRNLPYGDRDSLGWLQQRSNWGSQAERMNVAVAAGKFYDHLVRVPNWQGRPVGQVAQTVQVSGFPGRYQPRAAEAGRLLARVGVSLSPTAPPPTNPAAPTYCPQAPLSGLGGAVSMVATLNPAGAGNWQGAVHDGSYWYVAHATAGDRTQIIHRLDAQGRELDQMTAVGFLHATSFAVVGGTVYATAGSWDIVTFPYRPGQTVHGGQPTGWRGYISKDPAGPNVVVRNGNHYQAYNLATRKPVGVPIRTAVGPRQGFSISGTTVYVLTGATNGPGRVDSYSTATGRLVGTRDVTGLGADRAGPHREPEGMYGDLLGVKVNTGDQRRLLIFRIGGAATLSPSPAGFNRQGNPRTVEQAVAYMRPGKPVRPNTCTHEMAVAYGWPSSGTGTALTLWASIPANLKHGPTAVPPRGALVFWRTGNPAGHVALSVGGGMIASTDAPRGSVGVVPVSYINRWGPMVGWAAPRFPAHSKGVGA